MRDFGTPTFIRNMKVTHIVWTIAFIGLAIAVFYAQLEIRKQQSKSSEMHRVMSMVDLSAALSDYIHEQQKERGATAIFLSSEGRLYREELDDQRLNTDDR